VFCIRRGNPVPYFFTKRGRQNPLLRPPANTPRAPPWSRWDRKIGNTGLIKPLGFYPNKTHKMHHTNAAPPRPGETQASTTSATQNKPKAPTSDRIPILKLKHPPSKPRDTMTAGRIISGEAEAEPSASKTRPARPHGWTLQPMHHHGRSITPMIQRKRRGDILSSLPGLHDTIPSGKDTGRQICRWLQECVRMCWCVRACACVYMYVHVRVRA